MLGRILSKQIKISRSSSLQTLCRSYHSYPDPNEVPVITHYQHKPQQETGKIRSPEMIQQIADLKYRLSFDKVDPLNNQTEKNIHPKIEILPQITKLENGLTVVSVEADDMTMSSFVFLIKSGR
jgi:hypothetical protein